MYKKTVEEGIEYTRNIRFKRYTSRGTAKLVESTNENPNQLKLMIGTRTIHETEAKRIFRKALESAYKKVIASENKLIQ